MAVGPVVGLDIGSQQMKVVEIRPSKSGTLTVSAIGVAPTPFGVLQNDIITDPQLMGQAIRQLLRESGATSRRIIGSVAGQSSVVIRIIEVPKMSDAELRETMKWEVERHVPFPPNEIVKDYQPLDPLDPLNDTNPNMEVLLVVAQQDIINNYIEAVEAARVEPIAIDVEPLAVSRALLDIIDGRPVPRSATGANTIDPVYGMSGFETVAIVNMGASITDISIYQNGQLSFPRFLPLAGDSLTRAIAEMLGYSMEQAERIKRDHAAVQLDRMSIYTGTAYGDGSGYEQPIFTDDDLNFDQARDSGRISGRLSGRLSSRISGRRSGEVNPLENPFDLSGDLEPFDPTSSPLDLGRPQIPGEMDRTQPISRDTLNLGKPTDLEGTSPFFETAQPEAQTDGADANLRELVFEAIAPVLGELATELRRSLEYYRSRAQGRSVDRVILTGGTANLRNIDQFLQNELQVPVVIADPFHGMTITTQNFDPNYLRTISSAFTVAVGLASREAVFEANPAPRRAKRARRAAVAQTDVTQPPVS